MSQSCRKRSASSLFHASEPSGSLSRLMFYSLFAPASCFRSDFTRTWWLQPRRRLGPRNLARTQLAARHGAGGRAGGRAAEDQQTGRERAPNGASTTGRQWVEPRGTLCSLLIHPLCWRRTRSTLARSVSCRQGRREWPEKGVRGNLCARLCECWKTF